MIKSVPPKTIGYKEDEKTYTFASYPRAFVERFQNIRKSKFRNQAKFEDYFCKYENVMYDKRIIRGSAGPRHVVSVGVPTGPYDEKKQLAVRQRVAGRRPVKVPLKRTISPPPVRGKQNIDVQTETFLEELASAIEVYDEQCQTDFLLDRPTTPAFIQAKRGIDVQTQIYDGELFNFDSEVVPLIQVIVGKTIEQALLEVVHEEEILSLREQRNKYEQLRYAQMMEQQRLEEEERRLTEEKKNRIRQHEIAMRNQEETTEKVAAVAFAQSYLVDLASTVFQNLTDGKYFYDTVEKNIEQLFMPWLMDCVVDKLDIHVLEYTLLDDIVSNFIRGAKKFMPILPSLPRVRLSGSDMEITPEAESELEEESVVFDGKELLYGEEGEYEIEEAEEELASTS